MGRIVHVKIDMTFCWCADYDELYGKDLTDEQITEIAMNNFVREGDSRDLGEWARDGIVGAEVEHNDEEY